MIKIMDIKIKFGMKIKNLRNEKRITQEKLAELAGIDRSYISDIERGVKNISLQKIEALAEALGVEIQEIFKF